MTIPARLLHHTAYLGLLGILIPLWLFSLALQSGQAGGHSAFTFSAGMMVVLFCAARLSQLAVRCPNAMLHIVFYIFVYLWAGVIPLYQVALGSLPWRTTLPVSVYEATYLLIGFAILAFELGYKVASSGRTRKRGRGDVGFQTILFFSLAAIGLAVWFGPMQVPISALFSFREDLQNQLGDVSSRLLTMQLMRMPIYIAFLTVLWKLRTSRIDRGRYAALMVAVLPVFLLVNFPTVISRAWLGAIIISISYVFMTTSKHRYYGYFPLVLILGFLTIFPIMQRFRRSGSHSEQPLYEQITQTFASGDFDVFTMTAHFINMSQVNESFFTWGNQLLGALLFFVPRSVWSEKPVGSGYHVAEMSGFNFLNVSAPLWAEGFINFGLIGTFIFMLLLGMLLKRLDSFALLPSHSIATRVMIAFLVGFLTMILRGDLMTACVTLLPALVTTHALHMLGSSGRSRDLLPGNWITGR